MTDNFIDISPTLTRNSGTIRMHEDFACEISLLSSKSVPFWFPTSPMQPLQTHLESVEEKARPSSSATFYWIAARCFLARADVERSCTALRWSFASGLELPVSSGSASFGLPAKSSEIARAADSSDRRALLSLQGSSLGAVFDGLETMSSKPRCLPGPAAFSWPGGDRLLVANHQHHSGRSAKTHTSVGVRPDPGHYLLGHRQRLGLAAVSFSSHQPAARQPGKTQ